MTATTNHVMRWHLVVDLVDHLVEGFDVEQLHLKGHVSNIESMFEINKSVDNVYLTSNDNIR